MKSGYIYTVVYYSTVKNNEFMKFADKWMHSEEIILNKVSQMQKDSIPDACSPL